MQNWQPTLKRYAERLTAIIGMFIIWVQKITSEGYLLDRFGSRALTLPTITTIISFILLNCAIWELNKTPTTAERKYYIALAIFGHISILLHEIGIRTRLFNSMNLYEKKSRLYFKVISEDIIKNPPS